MTASKIQMSMPEGLPVARKRSRPMTETLVELLGMPMVLVVLICVFAVLKPNFLSFGSITNVSRSFAPLFVASAGLTLVMIIGGIDLSLGATASLASVAAALVMREQGSVGLGVAAGVLLGAAVGACNGLAISIMRLPPFVLTLSSMLILRATAMIITGGYSVGRLPRTVLRFGRGTTLDLSNLLLVALAVLVATSTLLYVFALGRKFYLVGTNERAAVFSGIEVRRTKFLAYLLCGGLAGLAGVLIVFRLGSGGPVVADNLVLMSIGAVVLGGTGIYGGYGSTLQTAVGAGVIAVLDQALSNMGLTFFDQSIALGAVILFGSAVSIWAHRGKSKRR